MEATRKFFMCSAPLLARRGDLRLCVQGHPAPSTVGFTTISRFTERKDIKTPRNLGASILILFGFCDSEIYASYMPRCMADPFNRPRCVIGFLAWQKRNLAERKNSCARAKQKRRRLCGRPKLLLLRSRRARRRLLKKYALQ